MTTDNKVYYTYEEVAKHNKVDDCYIIIYNEVFNVTEFMKKDHSGWYFPLQAAGRDCTAIFISIHPLSAHKILKDSEFRRKYYKGHIKEPKEYWIYDKFYWETKEEVENYLANSSIKPRDDIIIYIIVTVLILFYIFTFYLLFIKGLYIGIILHVISTLLFLGNIMHPLNHGGITKKDG